MYIVYFSTYRQQVHKNGVQAFSKHHFFYAAVISQDFLKYNHSMKSPLTRDLRRGIVSSFPCHSHKGQLISKANCQAEDSSKKRTKTRRILVKTNSFVRFLEESSA